MMRPTDINSSVDPGKDPLQRGRRSRGDAFDTEAELVREFLTKLQGGKSPWGPVDTAIEWDYRSGVADVLARNQSRDLIAFEAKLSDWRRACHQAYRSTAYADVAYVVLPETVASRAARESEVFARYGVGLVSCSVRGIDVVIEAKLCEPLLKWLTARAHATFDKVPNDAGYRLQRRSKRNMQTA